MASHKEENNLYFDGTEILKTKGSQDIYPRSGSTFVVELRLECHLTPWPVSSAIDLSGQYFLLCHEGQ